MAHILQLREARMEARNPTSIQDVIDRFTGTNFRSIDAIVDLNRWLESAGCFPRMPLGWCKGMVYELRPATDILQPTRDFPTSDRTHTFVPGCAVLGCNRNVEPLPPNAAVTGWARRNQNISEQSTQPTESDDFQPAREDDLLIFQQVGRLWVYYGDYARRDDRGFRGSWVETDYVVVTEISDGRPGALWIVYNFWRQYDDTYDYYHFESDTEPSFPSEFYEDYVACAKIGESLEHWQFSDSVTNQFELTYEIEHEPELVHVHQAGNGNLPRYAVAKTD